MAQQIMIVGLGQFGMSLAQTLSQKGAEVLAIDRKKHLVEEAAAFVTQSVMADATDDEELARFDPANRDVAVCAIGDESKEGSIICTALLRQMGAPYIVARANDTIHRRILSLVGAHQVINPEQEFGYRFANRLLYRNVIADSKIGEDLQIAEIRIQPTMVGKNLIELELPKRFSVMVVGVRKGEKGKIVQPLPGDILAADDRLIIVSNEAAISKILKEV